MLNVDVPYPLVSPSQSAALTLELLRNGIITNQEALRLC